MPVFDDDTVKRMFNGYSEQKELLWVYDKQLKIWQECQCQINQQQATEINRLQKQMKKLKTVVDKLLRYPIQIPGCPVCIWNHRKKTPNKFLFLDRHNSTWVLQSTHEYFGDKTNS